MPSITPQVVRFNCPSCGQKLSIQPEFSGQQIACPSCRTPAIVPALALRSGGVGGKVAAAVLILAILGGATFLFTGKSDGPGATGTGDPSTAPPSVSATVPGSPANLADQIHGKPIKRSGADRWENAAFHYREVGNASDLLISTQAKKGTLGILTGVLVIDQVTEDLILATHRSTREQWLIRPDNPLSFQDIAISENTYIVHLAGIYAGPEQITTVLGAERRLPSIVAMAMETSVGFLNFEDPAASKGTASDLNRAAAAMKADQDRRAAQHEAQRAADRAELEKENAQEERRAQEMAQKEARAEKQRKEDEAAYAADVLKREQALAEKEASDRAELEGVLGKNPNGRAPVWPAPGRPPREGAANDLATAKADLAAVKSRIESERKRFTDALQVINTLTNNKTVPVKEGSPAYHRCMEASRIIADVEKGAPDLTAEKARLETLVGELDPEVQE